jgi:hypothetical protein
MLNYSNRSIVKSGGNIIQIPVAPSFTMSPGDVIIQGPIMATIVTVNTQNEVQVDDDIILANGNATISQTAQTLDLRTVDDGGGAVEQINSYLNTPVDKALIRYDDNVIQSVGSAPRVAYVATSNGGIDWTDVAQRTDALSEVAPEVVISPAGSDVRLRFFSAVTSGDGISILENYRIFMHKRFFVGTLLGPIPSFANLPRVFEFKVFGEIESPNLEATSVPSYNTISTTLSSAILSIGNGKIGSFRVNVVSFNPDGTGAITHVNQLITLALNGASVVSLSFADTTIPANRVVKLLTQHVSGGKTANISVLLQ